MTYLDYQATTKTNEEVLEIVKKDLFTMADEKQIEKAKKDIQNILETDQEVNITSGSSESNNWAIKGICEISKNKKIITTEMEHSSIFETLKCMKTKGFEIIYAPLKDGIVNLKELELLLQEEDICLITISSVNTETGTLQPIEEISKLSKKYNKIFHSDMTGSIGKINIPLKNIDLVSFTAHKFYGPKGIGILLKNKDIKLKKIIYGKRLYNLGLLNGLVKSLEIAEKNIEKNYKIVKKLNIYLKENIKNIPDVSINQSKCNIPYTLNISMLRYKPETFLHYLEGNNIYISTQSACSSSNSYSKSVYALTESKKQAETSIRISLSPYTTKKELDKLIDLIKRGNHAR